MTDSQRPSATWEALGAVDADWAVETRDERMHGGWEAAREEFYLTGARRLDEAYQHLGDLTDVRRVLDFGSGTGRLTFNLAKRFEHVTAADISSTMLTELKARAQARGIENVTYIDLAVEQPAPDHDLAVCLITLQHIPDEADLDRALATIAGALRPGGRVAMDYPTNPHSWRRRLQLKLRAYQFLRALGVPHARLHSRGITGISMRFEAEADFTSRLARVGLMVVSKRPWHGSWYGQVEYVARRV